MRYTEPTPPEITAGTREEQLRKELEDLKRQLRDQKRVESPHVVKRWRPSGLTITAMFLAITVLIVVAFFAG